MDIQFCRPAGGLKSFYLKLICIVLNVFLYKYIRGRSQLSTFMKAYTSYARGRAFGTTVRFSPENQHLILITDNVLYNTVHV